MYSNIQLSKMQVKSLQKEQKSRKIVARSTSMVGKLQQQQRRSM